MSDLFRRGHQNWLANSLAIFFCPTCSKDMLGAKWWAIFRLLLSSKNYFQTVRCCGAAFAKQWFSRWRLIAELVISQLEFVIGQSPNSHRRVHPGEDSISDFNARTNTQKSSLSCYRG